VGLRTAGGGRGGLKGVFEKERASLTEGYRQAKGSMEGGRTGYQQRRQLGNKGIKRGTGG